tara:strand:- start:9391 stop:9612 length:222 start_codon:yes stop_codon:yes gene_type:complete
MRIKSLRAKPRISVVQQWDKTLEGSWQVGIEQHPYSASALSDVAVTKFGDFTIQAPCHDVAKQPGFIALWLRL